MGNYGNKARGDRQEVYCLRDREVRIMSEIWKSVETDLGHYGSQFYSLLFHNHPEYFKYFQENKPHEFQVDVPAMRTKFSVTCSTLANLFVEYSHKPQQRDHLLGYVAMIHKDMDLTQKDMDYFMMDMMDMLMQNFPTLMTADCCLAYVRYTESLTSQLSVLMKKQREVYRMSKGFSQKSKKNSMAGCFRSSNCAWLSCPREDLIYGRPAEYWEEKSRHWIVQRAVWATMYGEKSTSSSRTEMIPKSIIGNISQTSLSVTEESTSSDPIRDEDSTGQAIKKQSIRRKKQFRKKNTSSTISNDDVTDDDVKIVPKSTDVSNRDKKRVSPQIQESSKAVQGVKTANSSQFPNDKNGYGLTGAANFGRRRRVSILKSTARERRRKDAWEEVSDKEYHRPATRRLTILSGFGTGKSKDDSSSPDEAGERDFRSNLPKSPTVANKMRDQGTSISNVPNQSNVTGEYKPMETIQRPYGDPRRQSTFSATNNPPNSIIGSGGIVGRNAKTNKRVSISNAHWIESPELDK